MRLSQPKTRGTNALQEQILLKYISRYLARNLFSVYMRAYLAQSRSLSPYLRVEGGAGSTKQSPIPGRPVPACQETFRSGFSAALPSNRSTIGALLLIPHQRQRQGQRQRQRQRHERRVRVPVPAGLEILRPAIETPVQYMPMRIPILLYVCFTVGGIKVTTSAWTLPLHRDTT